MTTETNGLPPLAVVGGASGAIGEAAAQRLVACGWTVIGTYRRDRPKPAPGITWTYFDGADEEGTSELQQVLAVHPEPLKAVICCFGAPSSKLSVVDTDPDEFDAVFLGNVTSVVRLWQTVARKARQGDAGVVLLSSDTTATLRPGNAAYSAAKAGLEALATTLADEEAEHGVRVNVLAPSLVASPLAEAVLARKGVTNLDDYYRSLPWGRPLAPAEVGGVAVEIATAPHWRYASGQVVRLATPG